MTEPNIPQRASTSPLADRAQLQPEPAPPEPRRIAVPANGTGQVRKPFGTVEAKLAWPLIPGFKLRWFNDEPGRIDRAKEAGYEHVEKDGKPVTRIVGVAERGGGLGGFLMKIPNEFYDADFAMKQGAVDAVDDVINRGKFKEEAGDQRYVPKGGIKMSVQRGRG